MWEGKRAGALVQRKRPNLEPIYVGTSTRALRDSPELMATGFGGLRPDPVGLRYSREFGI